jgi:hypothetical protein
MVWVEHLCEGRPVLRACDRAEGSRAAGSFHHAASTVELKKTAKQKSLRSLEGLNFSHRTNLVLEDIHVQPQRLYGSPFRHP